MRLLDLIQVVDVALLRGDADRQVVVQRSLEALELGADDHGRLCIRQGAGSDRPGFADRALGIVGRVIGEVLPGIGQQRVEALHQLIDLVLVVLQLGIDHFHFALGHLFADPLLLAGRIDLDAVLDFAGGGLKHLHQAVVHFRTESGLGLEIVHLVADQGLGHVRRCLDLAAGRLDRALHVLLPLLFQSGALIDLLDRGGALGRGNPAVDDLSIVALQIQVARLANDGRRVSRLGGRRRGTTRRRRRPTALLGNVVQDRAGNQVAGIAGQGLACQGLGMFQVAGMEILEGQVVQSASARFNLLPGRGQTRAIDQGERPAAVNLRLIDQRDEVAVVSVGLQGGDVKGQLLRRRGHPRRSPLALRWPPSPCPPQPYRGRCAGRERLRVNVKPFRPLDAGGSRRPEHGALHGLRQAGAIGCRIHVCLFRHDHASGAGGQRPEHLLLDLGTDAKGDDRRPLGHQIAGNAVELLGREHVGAAAAVADINDGSGRLAVAREALGRRIEGPLQVAGAKRHAQFERLRAAAISGLLGATKPLVSGVASRSKATSWTRSLGSSLASAACSVASDLAR